MNKLKTVQYDNENNMIKQRELSESFKSAALKKYNHVFKISYEDMVEQLTRMMKAYKDKPSAFADNDNADYFCRNFAKRLEQLYSIKVSDLNEKAIHDIATLEANKKVESNISMFEYYKLESIFLMAESNHNEVSQLFISLNYNVKLPKSMRDRIPVLNQLKAKEGLNQ